MRARMDAESAEAGAELHPAGHPGGGAFAAALSSMDRERFGVIPGVTDREYYTNSFHIPVYFPISAFDKIRIEAPYHALTNAGHISYIEMDGDPTAESGGL